jgi:DNA topoisomerase I
MGIAISDPRPSSCPPRVKMTRGARIAAGRPGPRIATPRRRRSRSRANAEPETAATIAQLRYVRDTEPGVRRQRAGRRFRYLRPDGRPIRDLDTLRRMKALAIPPAWTDVWICADPDGHLQAVGRDAKCRKQYRYHPRWREVRDATKYLRLVAFGRALPSIRAHVEHALRAPGLSRPRVLATVLRLLEMTHIRVGNEEYARKNGSFGLTTLRSRHVRVNGGTVQFEFRGKGGKHHHVGVVDRRLARIVQRCQELPGYELFQYVDESGSRQSISSSDVNQYLRQITGQDFTAKDFRTWAGTVAAARELCRQAADGRSVSKRTITAAIATVAERLGNTPAICRRCYVHPGIIGAFTRGDLVRAFALRAGRSASNSPGLSHDEAALLRLLQRAEVSVDVHTERAPVVAGRRARKAGAA